MADYRIDLMDGTGRIVQQSHAKCDDDDDACALARRLLSLGGCAEVWTGSRCAGRVSAMSAVEVERLSRPWAARQTTQTSAGLRTDEKLSRLMRPDTAAGHLCDGPHKPA